MYNFKFGDTWISELGIMSSETPPVEIAQRDFELVKIPGKDGSDYVDNGRYENVEISRSVAMLTRSPFSAKERAASFIDTYAYLQGYQDFEDTDHNDMVTRAVLLNFKEVSRKLRTLHTATLKFSREPYWYLKGTLSPAEIDLSDDVPTVEYHNPYRAESEPIFRFTFTAGGPFVFQYRIITGGVQKDYIYPYLTPPSNSAVLTIDCAEKLIYFGSGDSKTVYTADIPDVFLSGRTVFQLISGKERITKIEIAPRWRCL